MHNIQIAVKLVCFRFNLLVCVCVCVGVYGRSCVLVAYFVILLPSNFVYARRQCVLCYICYITAASCIDYFSNVVLTSSDI